MNLKFPAQRGAAEHSAREEEQELESMQFASAVHPRRNVPFPDYTGIQRLQPLRNQNVRRIPAPAHMQKKQKQSPLGSGLIMGLLAKLRGGLAQEKKLRVLESVPLGEKRMVAIVEAQGRRFLVGCGANGVSLLTSLEDQERVQGSDALPLAGIAG